MKKAAKILFIIAIILGIAYIGYRAYEKYANKTEKVEETEGWKNYLLAKEASLNDEEYWVSYSVKNSDKKDENKEVDITRDSYGIYTKINSDEKYIVKASSSLYKVFEDKNGTKTTNNMSPSTYNNSSKINNIEYLDFLNVSLASQSENSIKNNFYSSMGNITKEENVVHEFEKAKNDYIWKTTYKCVVENSGVKYVSTFERTVLYGTKIKEVSYKIVNKELDANEKVKRKGDNSKIKISFDIEYYTNQSFVRNDFSEFPR